MTVVEAVVGVDLGDVLDHTFRCRDLYVQYVQHVHVHVCVSVAKDG